MTSVNVEGLDKLVKKINKLQPPQSNAIKRAAMDKSVKLVRADVAQYPPATVANSPANGYSWYQRGFGTRTTTGLGYQTSETLGRRWTDTIEDNGNRGVVGNNASYAIYVQDEDNQAGFHAVRGWPTVQKVIRDRSVDILDFFADEYREVLNA